MDYSLKNLNLSQETYKKLYKNEIYNLISLINFLPYKYEYYKVEDLRSNEIITVKANIYNNIEATHFKRVPKITFLANISNKLVTVIIFNREYLIKKLTTNLDIILSGKYNPLKNEFIANQVFFLDFKEKIVPLYKTSDFYSYELQKIILKALDFLKENIKEEIPKYYLNKYKLVNATNFYNYAHFAKTSDEIKEVNRKLKYKELLDLEIKYQYLRFLKTKLIKDPKNYDVKRIKDFIKNLPFELTKDQKKVTNEIYRDLLSKKVMNRLVEGDVGSGKTIVSLLASLGVVSCNYQVALMAPTEILANQHFNTFKKLLKNENINISLLTSSKTKKEKDLIYDELKKGKIQILIGTHSLLNTKLEFLNLGLIITDEQQRFGVRQRSLLKQKALLVDSLYLSATPIPRSMALTFFGDLDLSIIKQMPFNEKKITTKIIEKNKLNKLYDFIEEEVKKGHACYVVAPKIYDNDIEDVNNVVVLFSLFEKRFKNICGLSLLHAKLTTEEKNKALNDFSSLKTPILISTTVIEVGIDVKNASVMAIFDAHMFGLSQLHQLRGRIGRDGNSAYCFLITDKEKERLTFLENSNDGFYLAEQDLKLRGMGELLGEKQSGLWHLKYADLKTDLRILEAAKNDAFEMILNKKLFNDYEYRFLLKKLKEEDLENLKILD